MVFKAVTFLLFVFLAVLSATERNERNPQQSSDITVHAGVPFDTQDSSVARETDHKRPEEARIVVKQVRIRQVAALMAVIMALMAVNGHIMPETVIKIFPLLTIRGMDINSLNDWLKNWLDDWLEKQKQRYGFGFANLRNYLKLIEACSAGNVDEVKRLLVQEKVKPEVPQEELNLWVDKTPFKAAVDGGNVDVIRALKEQGRLIFSDKHLGYAGYKGSIKAAEYIIDCGVKPDIASFVPFVTPDIVKLFVEKGGDVNPEDENWLRLPLTAASSGGFTEIVEVLLESGADVNKGFPLYYALKHNHYDIAQMLVDSGADPLVKRDGEVTDLQIVIEKRYRPEGTRELIETMFSKISEEKAEAALGTNVFAQLKLVEACRTGNVERVEELLQEGKAKPEIPAENGKWADKTPFEAAVDEGHVQVIDLLWAHGLILNIETHLRYAMRFGNAEVIGWHLELGDKLEKDFILSSVDFKVKPDNLKVLIEKGVDENLRHDVIMDAFNRAIEVGYEDVVKMLLELGADVKQGSPIHEAINHGNFHVARLLVEKNADPLVKVDGVTAFQIAIDQALVQYLNLALGKLTSCPPALLKFKLQLIESMISKISSISELQAEVGRARKMLSGVTGGQKETLKDLLAKMLVRLQGLEQSAAQSKEKSNSLRGNTSAGVAGNLINFVAEGAGHLYEAARGLVGGNPAIGS